MGVTSGGRGKRNGQHAQSKGDKKGAFHGEDFRKVA
jgi:hypothetical protein